MARKTDENDQGNQTGRALRRQLTARLCGGGPTHQMWHWITRYLHGLVNITHKTGVFCVQCNTAC